MSYRTPIVRNCFSIGQDSIRADTYFGVQRPSFLHHGVEAGRLRGVFEPRGARRAGRAGAAVAGRVRHGRRERAGHSRRLRRSEQFVGQGFCGDCERENIHVFKPSEWIRVRQDDGICKTCKLGTTANFKSKRQHDTSKILLSMWLKL